VDIHPEQAAKVISDFMVPKEKKPIVLGKTLVDPTTYKPLAQDTSWEQEKAEDRSARLQDREEARLAREREREEDRRFRAEQAAADRQARMDAINLAGSLRPKTPRVPPQIQKEIANETEEVGIAASTAADLGELKNKIDSGQLQVGPVNNLISEARNFANVSNENSRNYQSFKATLEKLRNDSLRLNKGVQTEGDAQRAWNELMTNITDQKVVSNRLAEIININNRAVELRKLKMDVLRQPYGGNEVDPESAASQPSAIKGKPRKGEIVDGWEYIGDEKSDPSNRINWRKAK
jgi:hypothetical protein